MMLSSVGPEFVLARACSTYSTRTRDLDDEKTAEDVLELAGSPGELRFVRG